MFGYDDLVIIGFLAGEYLYHRWTEQDPPAPTPVKWMKVPHSQAGTGYSILYGRCRVHSPILVWASKGKALAGSAISLSAPFIYGIDQLLALGIPWNGGANSIRRMWVGDVELGQGLAGGGGGRLDSMSGHGSVVDGPDGVNTVFVGNVSGMAGDGGAYYGQAEVWDGRSGQQLVDGSGNPLGFAGQRMLQDGLAAGTITGFRNLLSVFLSSSNFANATGDRFWCGSSGDLSTFSFEAQSLPPGAFLGPNQMVAAIDSTSSGGTANATYLNGDINPMDALYDILCSTAGKLGMSPLRIDNASFISAANVLDAEGNGMSRCWDSATSARDMISDIFRQVDGLIYEHPTTGLITAKLIRPDFTVSAIPWITPDNCEALDGFAAGSWTNIPNKIRVNYPDRANDYKPTSATAQNQANAIGQNGRVIEVPIDMPGVCEQSTARSIAARELAARSRPLMKCTAVVNRSFYDVCPGDPVRLSWPEYGLSNVVFRVATVNRGTVADGRIRLGLLQDYTYVWRQTLITPPPETVKPSRSAGGATLAIRY